MPLNDDGLPYPLTTDSAALGMQLEALARAGDTRFGDGLDDWVSLAGDPVTIRSNTGGAVVPVTVETAVTFFNMVFDNQATAADPADILIPEQTQRYWWWVGVHLRFAAISVAAVKLRPRIYVQDIDPVSGVTPTTIITEPWYTTGVGTEAFVMSDMVRSGGGRVRVTLASSAAGAITINAGSRLWVSRGPTER